MISTQQMLPVQQCVYIRCNTSSHSPLSLQSYTAVLEVNRKEPSPLQFEAASLHIFQDQTNYISKLLHLYDLLNLAKLHNMMSK